MRYTEKNIFIIVPCYNEEKRLQSTLKEFLASPYRFVFVDDGSADATGRLLRTGVTSPNYLVTLPSNSGKAEAVRAGVQFIKGLEEYAGAEWIGYWDADLAAPVSEISRLLDYAASSGGADAVYGSRVMKLGSVIKRRAVRHILGRVFCTLISLLFGLKSYDTQCGAKLFSKSAVDAAFVGPFISRWIFDVEIILRLKDFRQLECPLSRWEDVKGSKITTFKTLPSVFADICRIYRKYR